MSRAATKKLGATIDKLWEFDQKIGGVERTLQKLKQSRHKEETKLLHAMKDIKLEKAAGHRASAAISRRNIPSIGNPRKFQKYVKDNDAFDLYQNRVSYKAYFARLEENEKVPGVKIFENVSVSIRKRGQ